ncbi:MAG: stage II sporulation protein D [Clostridia bacterium]|nr:stage II sporulation protein D [Clostridia bacterium]
MRNLYSSLLGIVFFSLLLFPLLAGVGEGKTPMSPIAIEPFSEDDVFMLKIGEELEKVSAEDYICGVVAAEMPALYEAEALKAQAVAAYTYAVRVRQGGEAISPDYSVHQAYIDKSARKEKWGENADLYETKIRDAIAAVRGLIITYDGEPITAAYHAISAGQTESAENVWGRKLPYLCSVKSEDDKTHENYKSVAAYSSDELCKKLNIEKPKDPTVKTAVSASESGYVLKFSVFDKEFTGSAVREALSLRSTNFTVEYKDDVFTFTVLGYGHGVGMSQYGANCMAKKGSTFREILLHYYPGCEIK